MYAICFLSTILLKHFKSGRFSWNILYDSHINRALFGLVPFWMSLGHDITLSTAYRGENNLINWEILCSLMLENKLFKNIVLIK